MGGILGGSQKSTTQIPEWVKTAAQQNIARANQAAQIGYTPYYGADVAAFTPMQDAAFSNTGQAANAFGLPSAAGNGMPAPQTFAGGVQGYSSGGMFDQALAALRAARPGQAAAIDAMFINPQTGQMGNAAMSPAPAIPTAPVYARGGAPVTSGGGSSYSLPNMAPPASSGGFNLGGYTSLLDIFDGGGKGAKGDGLLSTIGNFVKGK